MNLQGGRNSPCLHSQDCFSRKRSLKELLHFTDDDSGYIEGKVFMIWPPRNRLHRLNLEVVEDSALYRFETGITFRPHERVSLALKGVRVDQRKASSAPHYFPIVLRFPDGVVLKYLSGANAGRVVDSWEGNTDEWYNPGMAHTVSDAIATDASKIQHDPVPTVAHPCIPLPPRRDLTSHDEGTKAERPLPSSIAVVDGTAVAQDKRKKRKLHKEESTPTNQLANDTDRLRPADDVTPCHEQPQIPIHSHPTHLQLDGKASAAVQEGSRIDVSRESNHGNAIPTSEEASVPALRLKAGVRTQRGDVFTALSDLQRGHAMINVIGIVTLVNLEKKTKTNEWCRSFTLVDPSIVDSPRQSIRVNCFQKKYLEWLPQVQKDDIVILRKLKVVEFNGLTATGYSDKLRWAVYDPLEHSIRPPNKGSAPEKEVIDEGMAKELEYCRQIGEWWKAKLELEGQNVSIVRCSGTGKQHLLISEASPDHPPKGFFNCTIEVLQKFDNPCGATIVYVTDYTENASVHPVQATWCPPELHGRVLQCSMWDNARNIAKMMNPGEYWYLHNIRARWNLNQYIEGTMQLAEKVTQLDQTKQLEAQPHLRALLARKNEFESSVPSRSASLHIFPEMLFQDVEGSTSFLSCVVELLHSDLSSRNGHFIYVTDYTFNPNLPATVSTADWAHNLEHRVLKIKLDDVQANNSLGLMPGSMLIIHNLRVKHLDASGGIHGCLGGEDTLILSSHDLSSHSAQTLQRNKERWKRENTLNGSHEEAHGLLRQSSKNLGNTTLQEVLARPAPDVFRVLARAMDFFPFSLEDACVLRCTRCETSPPPSFKRCPRCDDMMETHSKWFYCLYLQLQDEKGDELIVSLSGKECLLLQDVDPTDFRCDRMAFHRFLTKLDPILGNLRDVHVAWSRNEYKAIESPLMLFTIESWNVGDERGYSLNCISTD
ncbi:hypothetical protein EV363DRAFT_1319733 [Boletus edulis]|nr:hypothetical protein EV363DRAFT_1319733 [Boletus edulis]